MEEANDSQGGVHPFSFFLFLFFTDTRHRHTLENSRACKFSAVPPPLLPSPPEDSFRGNEKTWLYRNCFAVFRPAYTISPSPPTFSSPFSYLGHPDTPFPPLPRHDKGLCMNGIRRRIVTRHRVLLPPWEKSGGVGSRSFHGFHGYTELRLLFFRSLEPRFISIRYGAFIESKGGG